MSRRCGDVFTGQVIGFCEFGLACGFFVVLIFHDFGTLEAQFDSCEAVDRVVDAAVVWYVASGHSAVDCIDNGITAQYRDIALPDIEAILCRGQVRKVCDSFCFCLDLQVGVLDLQEFFAAGFRLPDILKIIPPTV